MTASERLFVWAGGALFVASLALCAWWYLVMSGRSYGGPPSWPRFTFDAALFTVFAFHHSVFAREPVKRAVAAVLPGRLIRSVYVWTASLLLMIVCLLWQPVGGDAYAVRGAAALVLIAAQLAGVGVIAWSVRAIDPLELAGIRVPGRTADALQIRGPYRLVRHPLYLGWMVAVFGHPHMTGDRLAFAAITSIYLVAAIPLEERSLRAAFGDAYERYRRAVRWRVIPFVY